MSISDVQVALGAEHSDELALARSVILSEASGLTALAEQLDGRLIVATDQILRCTGRVVLCGVGKSGIAARKIAATLASLGTPALFLHAADAMHGDLGKLAPGDILFAISVSGTTAEVLAVANVARKLMIPVIAISAGAGSQLVQSANLALMLPELDEGSPDGAAPMASTLMTIALGDALASLAAVRRNFSRQNLAALHPGGRLGLSLRPVSHIMHAGDRLPLVTTDASVEEVIAEIGTKGFGISGVVDPLTGLLAGVVTDGDLRRQYGQTDGRSAVDIMSEHPVTLDERAEIGEALNLARTNRISSIFVLDADSGAPVGLVHLQDLLRLGIM